WLNHLQASPADPHRLLFCHEGHWHEVDRVWTIRTDGKGLRLLHKRTMRYEIAGHEFFSHDGKWVWYDLQTPRSKEFWLAGVNVGGEPVQVGKLAVTKLVDLSKHDYRLEPNVTITPDKKWVVFRSNMHGPTHVYAVEVAKSK